MENGDIWHMPDGPEHQACDTDMKIEMGEDTAAQARQQKKAKSNPQPVVGSRVLAVSTLDMMSSLMHAPAPLKELGAGEGLPLYLPTPDFMVSAEEE